MKSLWVQRTSNHEMLLVRRALQEAFPKEAPEIISLKRGTETEAVQAAHISIHSSLIFLQFSVYSYSRTV